MSDSPDPSACEADLLDPPLAEEVELHIARWLDNDWGPVPVRYRHDGWVPDRQAVFIETLADCGCVDEAARAVGMSRNSAYALRRRRDAQAFRLAWDAAMEAAVTRLRDAAMARAIHGVAVPVFHNGEQVGERRQFNERLTMFLLRTRAPEHYGKWRDGVEWRRDPEGATVMLLYRIGRMMRAAWRLFDAALAGKEQPRPELEIVPGDGVVGDDGPLH